MRCYGNVSGIYGTAQQISSAAGLTINQAFLPRFLTATARIQSQVRSYGIYGGQSGAGRVFFVYFGFSCQFCFLRLSSEDDTVGHVRPEYQITRCHSTIRIISAINRLACANLGQRSGYLERFSVIFLSLLKRITV
jgi:hypothetical protein